MAVTGTATTKVQTIKYFVIPQQPNADLMQLILQLFPGVGDNAAVPNDVIATDPTMNSRVIKAADWPDYATPMQ